MNFEKISDFPYTFRKEKIIKHFPTFGNNFPSIKMRKILVLERCSLKEYVEWRENGS